LTLERVYSSDFFLCDNSPKWQYHFFGGNLWRYILTFLVDEIARLLQISRWYPSFLDENTQIWMNNYTFIHNLDVSSTHMDEGGSCTVVKIASTLILIIEKKITGEKGGCIQETRQSITWRGMEK
jgi:hypothetical protein